MEFHNRKACIDYYDAQFPHLPRYMIEMAFDLDQTQSKKNDRVWETSLPILWLSILQNTCTQLGLILQFSLDRFQTPR